MKIKTKKTVTLLELVEMVLEGDMPAGWYASNPYTDENDYFIGSGSLKRTSDLGESIYYADRFDIDTEEDLNEDTDLPCNVVIVSAASGAAYSFTGGKSISKLKGKHFGSCLSYVYQQHSDGSIGQLIWSKENGFEDGTLEVST